MPASSRHHYIPQYFIRGFEGADKRYYVYDKQEDRIKRYHSAKQIFYEDNRNTVNERGVTHTHIEDKAYAFLDSWHSPAIERLRTNPITPAVLNPTDVGLLTAFLICQFWRVPKTDALWEDFFKRSGFTITDKKGARVDTAEMVAEYKAIPDMSLGHRAFLYSDTARKILNSPDVIINQKFVEISPDKGHFLLSDYPVLYLQQPTSLEGVTREEFFLPLSSRRVYYTVANRSTNWSVGNVAALNALLIDQSVRYVCGPDREHLDLCVRMYRLMKSSGTMELAYLSLFMEEEFTEFVKKLAPRSPEATGPTGTKPYTQH